MDDELYSKAKELKRNIAKLNDAISELDNERKWSVFRGPASQELRQEYRKFMVDLRDKLQKEFEEL